MRFKSAYPGTLVFPDGVEVAIGETVDADDANAGVADFVASGWIVRDDPPPVAPKREKQ